MPEYEAAKSTERTTNAPPALPVGASRSDVSNRTATWFSQEGPWWLSSFVFHLLLIFSLALVGGKTVPKILDEAPRFEEARVESPQTPPLVERFEVGETPQEPTELNTETLTLEKPAQLAQEAESNDGGAVFEHRGGGKNVGDGRPGAGGLGVFEVERVGPGPQVQGKGGVGVGAGARPGIGGAGAGFGGRGSGSRASMLAAGGGTRQSERAVAAALNWLARHQLRDGSWSLAAYNARCTDATCTGLGKAGERSAAATALAILPFLASGQTHKSRGPYQKNIAEGIYFLVHNQKSDGDLRMGDNMYDHGLAAIALCECYGMSNDKALQPHAQRALNFIMQSQNTAGGWRYAPGQPGDTSVTGWQIMALKSGQMAYLVVDPNVFAKTKNFLKSVAYADEHGGRFCYLPPNSLVGGSDLSTTAIGLLCRQYMDARRDDPDMIGGTSHLMRNLPDAERRNIYYWYYATQAMHNQPGPQWDAWNRKMRRILIDTQCKDGCAAGSWAPDAPTEDVWGRYGGRVMMTSLSALTLEVYYRYLPLYRLDKE